MQVIDDNVFVSGKGQVACNARLSGVMRVAVPVPLSGSFDYWPPMGDAAACVLQAGMRVRIPFGRRRLVGIIVQLDQRPQIDVCKIKTAIAVLDDAPIVSAVLLRLAHWVSDYYHYPIGEVLHIMLPARLTRGESSDVCFTAQDKYEVTEQGIAQSITELMRRAPKQARLLEWMRQQKSPLSAAEIERAGWKIGVRAALLGKQCLRRVTQEAVGMMHLPRASSAGGGSKPLSLMVGVIPTLNEEQSAAVRVLRDHTGFGVFLLDGVTGSGKTEVYLRLIDAVLQQGLQALMLVPEIGLTPQTVQRFTQRFSVPVVLIHSRLADNARHNAWIQARSGVARIIIGTRSAVFTPMANPGVLILDEEHDNSYNQMSGCRYSARDVAVMRGKFEDIPVVLGSATPALESVQNAHQQRYQRLRLTQRAGGATLPTFRVVDLRGKRLFHGLSPCLLQALDEHLAQGKHALLFLNRRGFAPHMLCHQCGWSARCMHCDVHLVWYQKRSVLVCHHCAAVCPPITTCPAGCGVALVPVGVGTERLEIALQSRYPDIELLRVDQESVRGKHSLQNKLHAIQTHRHPLLIGTQMLAKGHHFPKVTLVAVVDADHGLYSADFRATERMAQVIVQVAGRAGRADQPGVVYVQTHFPDQPLLRVLLQQGYGQFSEALLVQRHAAQLPPFAYLAVFRVQAKSLDAGQRFIDRLYKLAQNTVGEGIDLLGPMPCSLLRQADYYHLQLLVRASFRQRLHRFLKALLSLIVRDKNIQYSMQKVRWCLDVDPYEMV